MDATEGLKDKETCILNEIIKAGNQKEIIDQHCLTFPQLLLGAIKIKVDIETFQKLCDGIPISGRLLLYDFHQVLQHGTTTLVGDDSRGQVSQHMWAHGLDRVEISETSAYLIPT